MTSNVSTTNSNENEREDVSKPEVTSNSDVDTVVKQRNVKLRSKRASESQSIGGASLPSIDEGLVFNLDNNNEESKNQEMSLVGHKEDATDEEHCNGRYHVNGDVVKTMDSTVFCDANSQIANQKAATVDHLLGLQKEWKSKGNKKSRKVKKFYSAQDSFIEAILEAERDISQCKMKAAADAEKSNRMVNLAAKVSFFANIILMIAKLTASILSGSMAIISSLVDSVVDLVSGAVIFYTSRAAEKTNYYSYPFGRTRLEPAAIIIISVVMGLASFQIIVESIKLIVTQSAAPDMRWVSIGMVALTIVVKFLLFLLCRRIDSPSTHTLALDHRNDVIGNSFALLCGWLGTQYWKTIDPIGAILISMYISYNWWKTGSDQVKVITGKTAPPLVLTKITWLALHHDERILNIDTVRAFHLGSGFLTDVHVTLDENMNLKEAHDIGESLQNKLELLSEVEVAFVHLDYENSHSASSEHAFLLRKNSGRSFRSLSSSNV